MLKLPHNCSISHASKVMLKILQARLQQYMNWELSDVQAGFRKGRGTRDQIANICQIIVKARKFQKNIYFCFIDYAKASDCVPFSSVQSFSLVQLFVTPLTTAHQAFLSVTNSQSLPKLMSTESVMPSNHLILLLPFSSCLQSFPASRSFPMSQLFTWGGQSIGVSASTSVLQWTLRTDLLWDGLVGSPCSPRVSQESSPTPHFKSINSSALNFLYSPTLISIHDYWWITTNYGKFLKR